MEIDQPQELQNITSKEMSDLKPLAHTKKPYHGGSGTSSVMIRPLLWTYLHLSLLPANPTASAIARAPPIDALMVRSYLTAALTHFLGLMGGAIPVDILAIEGRDVWVRVPREDGGAVVEACSGWIGGGGGVGTSSQAQAVAWRVKGKSEWLGNLVAGDSSKLFEA